MAITRVTSGSTIVINDVNQLIDLLEGAASQTLAFKMVSKTGEDYIIKLADAAGARKFSVQDTAGVEVASINSDGALAISGSFTPSGTLILPASTSPATVTDAAIQWDSDDNLIKVGDGVAIKTFYPERPGMRLVGSNTAEQTTTATGEDNTLVTVTLTETVPAATPLYATVRFRKSSGAAAGVSLGLKVNATQVWSTGTTPVAASTATDRAEDGQVVIWIPSRATNYLTGAYASHLTQVSSSGASAKTFTTVVNQDAQLPSADTTVLVVTGKVGNALVTGAVRDVFVYAMTVA